MTMLLLMAEEVRWKREYPTRCWIRKMKSLQNYSRGSRKQRRLCQGHGEDKARTRAARKSRVNDYMGTFICEPFKDQAPQHPTVGARDQTESTTTALDGVTARPNKAKGVNKRPREGASPDASPQRATQSGKRIKRKDAPQLGSESLDGTKEAPLNSPGSSYAETVLKDGADNGDGFKVVKSKKKRTPKEKPSGEKKELPKPPLKLRSTEAVKITASDPKLYEDALSSALHSKAEVTPLVNKRSLEIKDLDEATSEVEVTAALREKLGKPDLKMECRLLPRYRGTKVALENRSEKKNVALATDCNEHRDECVKLRAEEAASILEMEEEVSKMLKSCEVQKNVNRTIKDGLRSITSLIRDVKEKHAAASRKDEKFYQGLAWSEDARKDRRMRRDRFNAVMLKNVVLESQKRKRSDPESTKDPKKKREEGPSRRSKGNKTKPAPKPNPVKKGRATVVVKVAEGATFAEVLAKVRKEADLEASQTRVVGALPTKKGDLLIKIGGSSNKKLFTKEVTKVIGDLGKEQMADRRTTLEIRDMDALTEKEDVLGALEKIFTVPTGSRKVTVLGPNKRGAKLAVVVTSQEDADKLEEIGHIKIGFVSCKIRRRTMVTWCHKCLDYGHIGRDCQGVDRSAACFKCGEAGHKAAGCKKSPCCFLCQPKFGEKENIQHVAGSRGCKVFRTALEEAKKTLSRTRRK
ncbi:uncharacterized protein LOC122510801 [Leptopilina heterotoma]|uniref:uncharacterized protein LOC122510801 n=1 Tax=Leptopilina heterotoma TaxID=63436 RepID=UPI001CA877CC|nr:uncharacterized protein LOC122510801 [Leptopilina heterotoma]